MAKPNVKVIPARPRNDLLSQGLSKHKKRRVAPYARVSTDLAEQLNSYEAQICYYTQHIKENPDWEFVKVYTDEGISGLMTKKREGFQSMIKDALAGKIDLILTKTVSRFARNTVDTLTTVRQLKDKGVEVFFEKENIYMLDSKGELMITIMSSLAQEESRSLSENVTWGIRKRFADGQVNLPYKQFLGYKKGENGRPEIIPEEAETVRLIYRLFIQGQTPFAIANYLTDADIPTPGGKSTWRHSTVESILTNEKYKGDALLQKQYTTDFLTKTLKSNEGQVSQYYVENSHPAIIDAQEWDLVQSEMNRRKSLGTRYNNTSPFSSRLICGDCGAYFGSKVWHSNSAYRRVIWQCNDKYKNETRRTTPHLYTKDIEVRFIETFSQLMSDKDNLLADGRLLKAELTDTTEIDQQLDDKQRELDVISGLIRTCIEENSSQTLDQETYQRRYDGYVDQYTQIKAAYDELEFEKQKRTDKGMVLGGFLFVIRELDDLPMDFSDELWNAVIDHVTVNNDGSLVFCFRNGSDVVVTK